MNAADFTGWPATTLMEGAVLVLFWLALATMRRRATATWLRTWWRVFCAVMLCLGAAAFAPVKWRIPVPTFHSGTESQVTITQPRGMPVAQAVPVSAPLPKPAVAATTPAAVRHPIPWRTLWAAGAALLLLRAGLSAWRVRRLIREAKPINGQGWLEDLEREMRGSGCMGSIPLLVHPGVRIPFAAGCFRPRIVLPTEAEHWEAAERRAVLHHELEHLRNRDLVWQWLAEAVAILHWPNPFLWMARRQLLLAQEMAVDDAVLAGGVSSVDYAALLTEVARQGRALSREPALVAMVHKSNLGRRVSRLLDSKQRRGALSPAWRTAMAVVGMACVFFCGFVGFRAEEQTPAAAGDSQSASAPPKIVPDARVRATRDTLHLEKAFGSHFQGPSDVALKALRQELRAAQIFLPSLAEIELNPSKDTLTVDFPAKEQEAVDAAESFLVHRGWLADAPANDWRFRDLKTSEAIPKQLRQFYKAVDDQRKKVIEEARTMALALYDGNLVDNDPLNPSTPITSMESVVIWKRNIVDATKAKVAEIEKLRPEELLHALPVLNIDDPTANKTLPLLQEAALAEKRLLAGGVAVDDPRVKQLQQTIEQHRETLSNALLSIRSAEATKLKIAVSDLESSEQRLKAATQNAAAAKQKVFDYVNAKTVYLEDKRILDNMTLQYAAELVKQRVQSEPPAKTGKKP